MSTDSSKRSFNNSYEKMMHPYSASACISWLVVLITECLAIVILNLITIIVFVKKRQLRRRSTYLIIHLAIVDLLVGAVSGPLHIEQSFALLCNLWKMNWSLAWPYHVKLAFLHLFSFTSQANLVAISVERLHATFCPIRHHFVTKWVYRVIIIVIWLTSTTREVVQVMIREISGRDNSQLIAKILYIPFYFIYIFVICLCYIQIVIKVRCSRRLHHFHGATKGDRKLTGTSLIVAILSLLCFLPALTFTIVFPSVFTSETFPIYMTVLTTYLANSLINPIVYALRMPGFRAGVSHIFCRAPRRITPVELPIRDLRGT